MANLIKVIFAALFAELFRFISAPKTTTVEDAESKLDRLDPLPKAERNDDLVRRAPSEWLR